MTFAFEADTAGRLSVREESSGPGWPIESADAVDLPAGLDGASTITIRKGDRIAWHDPGGLDGCVMFGAVAGLQVQDGELSLIGIDAEPSETLRAIGAKIQRDCAPHEDPAWRWNDAWPALAGDGGPAIFVGEYAYQQARAGKLYLAPRRVSWATEADGTVPAWAIALGFSGPETKARRDLDELARAHHADRARAPHEGESYATYRGRLDAEPPYVFTLDPGWADPHDVTWWRSTGLAPTVDGEPVMIHLWSTAPA